MRILAEKPPEWIMSGCMDKFRVSLETTVWTYGDTIYNPGGKKLPDHLIVHEATHMRQQDEYEGGKDAWWKRYLTDAAFRAEQEAQAYGMQYAYHCDEVKDRNKRAMFLHALASTLAGPLYQVAISRSDAMRGIREISGVV